MVAGVRDIVDQARIEDPDDVPVVIGPHYTICAQLHAGLDRDIAVGCHEAIRDDFDDWLPKSIWENADQLLFVTDNRFPVDLHALFPQRFESRTWEIPIARGGRLVRTFHLTLLLPRALGDEPEPSAYELAFGAIVRRPASRISERSSSSSGFGVVRSLSP